MIEFIKNFRKILVAQEEKGFVRYLVVLFFGSVSAILGIGAVIPFISILIRPEKIEAIHFLSGYSYHILIVFFAIILILAFWIKNSISALLLFYQSRYLEGVVKNIQERLFAGYMQMPYEQQVNNSTPVLIRNINNETVQFSVITNALGVLLTELFASFFVVVALLIISWLFSMIIIVAVMASIVVFMRVMRSKSKLYGQQRAEAWKGITSVSINGFKGIKESKLYHCEHVFIDQFSEKVAQLKHANIFDQLFTRSPKMLIESVALTVTMLVVSGFILLGYSPAKLFVLLSIFGVAAAQLLPSMNRISQSIAEIRYAYPALNLIQMELSKFNKQKKYQEERRDIKALTFKKTITIENLHYSYTDGTAALKGIDVTIDQGKKVAFVGRSGAGKTTFIDLLMGLYYPQKGKIIVDDKLLKTNQDVLQFQKLFGYIPQSIILYDLSVEENIAFGVPLDIIDRKRVAECLEIACLFEFVEQLPLKQKTIIGENGVRLSGGQRQRIGIARALYHRPKILVMDEATSALDNEIERDITKILSSFANLTMITIAHRLTTIKSYDMIYVMKEGNIFSSGNYDYLIGSCPHFKKMVEASEQMH